MTRDTRDERDYWSRDMLYVHTSHTSNINPWRKQQRSATAGPKSLFHNGAVEPGDKLSHWTQRHMIRLTPNYLSCQDEHATWLHYWHRTIHAEITSRIWKLTEFAEQVILLLCEKNSEFWCGFITLMYCVPAGALLACLGLRCQLIS